MAVVWSLGVKACGLVNDCMTRVVNTFMEMEKQVFITIHMI